MVVRIPVPIMIGHIDIVVAVYIVLLTLRLMRRGRVEPGSILLVCSVLIDVAAIILWLSLMLMQETYIMTVRTHTMSSLGKRVRISTVTK